MAEIAGLKLIVPSSVAGSGVSVSASGKVTFTAATSVSVNGCFSSTYDNYLIVMQSLPSSGGANMRIRLRLSGTDASGSNYVYQSLLADATTVSGARATSDNMVINLTGGVSSLRDGTHLYFYGPNLAQPTAMRSVTGCAYNSALIYDHAGTHSLSTAYDGFTVYTTSPNLTGSLTIYGLSQ